MKNEFLCYFWGLKKILSILLLMVYTAASSGTVISAHYCMGDLASVSFGERNTKGCSFCGMEDEGCCHDLPQVIKMENSNLESPIVSALDFQPSLASNAFSWHSNKYGRRPKPIIVHDFGNQVLKPPAFLLNCSFRI